MTPTLFPKLSRIEQDLAHETARSSKELWLMEAVAQGTETLLYVTCSPLVALRGTRQEKGSSLGLLRCSLAHIPFLLQWGKHVPAL